MRHLPWHADPWRRISAARAAQRLPHAILLAGPQGLGKAEFARRLADALVCNRPDAAGDACGACPACRLTQAGSHPDLHLVMPEEAGKMIKIEAIRDLTAKSVLAAQAGGYRVFVIDPAEAMNRAAANAVLKTLEEPASRSVLILVSSHPDRLPPTIRSRCQRYKFGIPDGADVRGWLREEIGPDGIDELVAISAGAPLRALRARDEGWVEAAALLLSELAALKRRKINPMQIVEKWEERSLTLIVDGLKRCLADLIKLANGLDDAEIFHPALRVDLQSLGQGIDLQELYALNDDVFRLDRDAPHNLNKSMQLEHLVNYWLKITRPGGH